MKTEAQIIKDFVWGKVIKAHTIGDYLILEHHPQKLDSDKYDKTTTEFHPYVNGKDTNQAFLTLDAALIGCICLVNDGYSTRAAKYIFRILGMKDYE